MGTSWQDKHREHALWEVTQSTLDELRSSYEEVDPADSRYGQLRDLLAYVLTFQDFPQVTVTPATLDAAHNKIQQIQKKLPHLDSIYQKAGGTNTSAFGAVVAAIRPWPLPGSGRLTGLSKQVEQVEATLSASEQRMFNAAQRYEEHLEERRAAEDQAQSQHLEAVTQKFKDAEAELQAEQKVLNDEIFRIKGLLESSEKKLESHVDRFEETFKNHETALRDQLSEANKDWERQLAGQRSEAERHREAMEKHEQQSIRVLTTVGTNATASDYGQYAEAEAEKADKWRTAATWTFVAAAALFVGAMGLTFFGLGPETEWWEMVLQRIGAPAGVAGIGLFLGRESGLHREVSRKAKQTELTLNALEPFIANLPDTQQEQIRYDTARALFARDQGTPLDNSETPRSAGEDT